MCGTAGTSYSIAFFLDHQPVKLGESTCCSVALSKGGVMELEAVIDPDKLGQFNTFYCVAVPQNGASAPFFSIIDPAVQRVHAHTAPAVLGKLVFHILRCGLFLPHFAL